MPSTLCETAYVRDSVRATVKLLVAGAFGVGKTTLIGSVSEITPLRTEEVMTQAGAAVDDLTGIEGKLTTTVALDFGRLTLGEDLALFLFGTPGQSRFLPLWQDLAHGAYGALVLADTRALQRCFDTLALVEQHGLPYVVAVNRFPDSPAHPEAEVRQALDLEAGTPLVTCDARDHTSSRSALIALVAHLHHLTGA
ncbi:GTP-binding protein [Streptomyces aidingensis]|uniref:Signal recognition particle receptor subunit beta, a GTPase n=1 Tax=Streptomyces aidingensis TaxID=910347 RepID=A0A1I1VAT1_9ACTN|nr:ATP/GTP-binding protein [Streptomyces aidingensis]SFD80024.1 Signal recognition particle receptor subunit beta, a GTPase [Streptomyces aidingensis]